MLKIRPARPADSPALATIQLYSYKVAYADLLPGEYFAHMTHSEQKEEWEEILSNPTDDTILVAEHKREVVGYALSRPEKFKDYEVELVALHVSINHRKKGVGTALVQATAAHFAARGFVNMFLWVLKGNPAEQLYKNLGAQFIAEKEWSGNDHFGVAVHELAYGWQDINSI
jgi:ribosomal protein S18 acetylase RimI-like enzyme